MSLFFVTPAEAQSHPLRITLGYDPSSSRENSSNSSGSIFFSSETTGAVRLGLSYDVAQNPSQLLTTFLYADLSQSIFSDLYNGFGAGVRFQLEKAGSGGYAGGGAGFYNLPFQTGGNSNGIGLRLSLGYETKGAFFVETNLTLLDAPGYKAKPAVLVGLRF